MFSLVGFFYDFDLFFVFFFQNKKNWIASDDCQESIVSFVPDENDVNVLRCKSCADKKLATEEQQAQSKPKQQKKKSASGLFHSI